MNDDDDDMVFNEPVATGWLRTELRGDKELAKGHVHAARKLLGAMRTMYGVNQRIAEGQGGGFYHRTVVQSDGSVVQVISNDGQDTIRINSPQTFPMPPPEYLSLPAPHEQHVVYLAGTQDSGEGHFSESQDESPAKKIGEESELVVVDSYRPYLWIGVRQIAGRTNSSGNFTCTMHACVWEMPVQEGAEPVILSNRNNLVANLGEGPEVYPLQRWTQFSPDNPNTGIAYTNDKLCMLLAQNGLPMTAPGDFDDATPWDVIFFSDPDNELALTALDGTPMAGADGGKYFVKVMMIGNNCIEQQPCTIEMRVITGKDHWVEDTSTTFVVQSQTSYRMGILPLGYFQVNDDPPDLDECITCDDPVWDNGTNRHGPHWWQGMASIVVAPAQYDVPANTLAVSTTHYSGDGEVALPPTGFVPAAWWDRIDLCAACEGWQTYYGAFGATHLLAQWYTGFLSCEGFNFGGGAHPGAVYSNYTLSVMATTAGELGHSLFADYGLPSTTMVYDENNVPVTEVNFKAGAPESEHLRSVAELRYQYTLAEGAVCFAGFWFEGPPTPFAQLSDEARSAVIEADAGYACLGNFSCWFKYTITYDKHNAVTNRTASYISKQEYDSAPDKAGNGGKSDWGCTRVEQDY